MYINFQQNQVNRSVITVHTNLFAKNRKFHKFATTNSIFLNQLSQTCIIEKSTCISSHVSRSVKTVHTNLFAKNCKLHKCLAINRDFVHKCEYNPLSSFSLYHRSLLPTIIV